MKYICGFAATNGKHLDPQKLGRCAICKKLNKELQ